MEKTVYQGVEIQGSCAGALDKSTVDSNSVVLIFDRHQSYTYAQAARFLGVSVRTVMREAKAERLVIHKVRGCTRIHGADLLAYQQEGKLK